MSNTASHFYHEKSNSWVSMSMGLCLAAQRATGALKGMNQARACEDLVHLSKLLLYCGKLNLNALVFSKLFYCSNVWANSSNCNIDKLQSVHNFACRIVSGAGKFDHITPILKELEWLPVSSQLYY